MKNLIVMIEVAKNVKNAAINSYHTMITFLEYKKRVAYSYFLLTYASPYFYLNLSALPPTVSCLKLPVQYG